MDGILLREMMAIPSLETLLYCDRAQRSAGAEVVDQSTGGPVAVHESITAGSLKWYAATKSVFTPDKQCKKALIYHDSFWPLYTAIYQERVLRHLGCTAEEGFTVYIYQDDHFFLLKNPLHAIQYGTAVKSIDSSLLEEKLSELEIPRHQISLLDHVGIRMLLSYSSFRHLADMVNPSIFLKAYRVSSIERLKKDSRIRGVDCTSKASYAFLENSACSDLAILSLKIDQDHPIERMPPNRILDLEVLEIDNLAITEKDLLALISRFPRLRFLRLGRFTNLGKLSKIYFDLSLKHLEVLKLSECHDLSSWALVSLLAGSPNIGSLSLYCGDFRELADVIQHKPIFLNQLTILDISDSTSISAKGLLTLISQCPDITSISLAGDARSLEILPDIDLSAVEALFLDRSLEKLTKLRMVHYGINSLLILQLVRYAPNLEYLMLLHSGAPLFVGDEVSQACRGADWRRLRELVLEFPGKVNLLAFMACMPNIEKMHVDAEIIEDATLLQAPLFWDQLSSLEINHLGGLPPPVLLKLLEGAPNLTSLRDWSTDQKPGLTAQRISALPGNSLRNLEDLYISRDGSFSPPVLREIQMRAPSIEIHQRKSTVTPRDIHTTLTASTQKPSWRQVLGSVFLGAAGLMLGKAPVPQAQHTISTHTNPPIKTFKARKQVFPISDARDISNADCRQKIIYWSDIKLEGDDIRIVADEIPRSARYITLPMYDSLEEMSVHLQPRPGYDYYDVPCFQLSEGKQALLTITADDQIVGVLRPKTFCEFYHDEPAGQYYVTAGQASTLRYVLAVPKVVATEASLPEEVKGIYQKYRTFQKRALTPPDNSTPRNIIKAMQEQETGSCEQRSLACLEELEQAGIQARLVRVFIGCHAYLEVRSEAGEWVRVDLGGYPIHYQESVAPFKPLELQSTEASAGLLPAADTPSSRGPSELSAEHWFKQVASSVHVKQYWTFQSNQVTHLAAAYLVQNYRLAGERVFFVNQADQLRCLINTLILEGPHQGKLNESPSGAFKEFLCSEGSRILIIDWNSFKPEEIACCLGLLDGNFNGEDIYETLNIPRGLRVVSLQNIERIQAYCSKDFLTRHAAASPCVVAESAFKSAFKIPVPVADPSVFTIDLYHSEQWERYLWGSWSLRREGFYFEPTEFFKALQAGRACRLQLINPPIENAGFERMRLLLEVQRDFSYLGIEFKQVQVDIACIAAPTVLWERRAKQIQPATESAVMQSWVLNPTSLHAFLGCESVSDDGNLVSEPGILEQNREQVLGIIVSHDLGSSDWAKLLDAAQLHSVSCNVTLANGVFLPSELERLDVNVSRLPLQDSKKLFSPHAVVIQTDNMTDSVQQYIRHRRRGYDRVDILRQSITGCLPRDVFYQLGARKLDIELGRFSDCYLERGPILDALLDGKEVILTGSLSLEMQEFLAPLLTMKKAYLFFNNKRHQISGRLVLVTDTALAFCPFVEIEHSQYANAIHSVLLRSQVYEVPAVPTVVQLKQADSIAKQLYQDRERALTDACRKASFVTIVGSTASGKTTFMQDFKRQRESAGSPQRIYWGTQELQAFLEKNDRDSLLFLDEFTLLDPELIEKFSDLSQNPPCLWMNRRRYEIKGKVVVATNAQDYGNRQGVAVCNKSKIIRFEPLPLAVLYAKSIKPVLLKTGLSEKMQERIGRHFLVLYVHCLAYDRRKASISARELEFIALSFAVCYTENRAEPENLAKQIAYNIATTLVSEEYLNLKIFKPKRLHQVPLPSEPVQITEGEPFVFLREHQEAWNMLNYILKAQAFNQAHALAVKGINHLSLMGDSNIGKSAFLRAACIALGQQERMEYLPASALLETQRAILSLAATQGKVLIHDEINTAYSTKLEKERNAYLGGMDLEGKSLRSDIAAPSFLYLSTKNPAGKNFSGRAEETLAESRRMIQLIMPTELSPQSVAQLVKSLSQKQHQQPRLQALLTEAEKRLKQRDAISVETVKRFYRECRGPGFFQVSPGGHAAAVMRAEHMDELIARLYEHYKPGHTNPSTATIKRFGL